MAIAPGVTAGAGSGGSPTTPAQFQSLYPTVAKFGDFLNSYFPNKRLKDAKFPGNDVAEQWAKYEAKESKANPSLTLGDKEYAFFTVVAVEGVLEPALTIAVDTGAAAVGAAGQAAIAGSAQAAQALSPLASVAGFLGGLESANLWIRAAKVIAGGAMLLIGLAHMTGAESALGKVTKHIPIPL